MAVETPTLAQIIARLRADFRSEAGIDPLRRSVEYALLRALAGQSKGQYGYINFLFGECFPDTASESAFWRWAAIWGITQQAATAWTGQVVFTGDTGEVIPAGTVLTRSDGLEYTTDADATIAEGEASADITASTAGSDSNNDDGQTLVLATPIANVDNEATVESTIVDGTDVETQADGLTRLLLRIRNGGGSGGRSGDYVAWAREVEGVTRAWEFPLLAGPNTVSVAFVRDNDGTGAAIIPDAGERTAVDEYVQSQAPVTVDVQVIELTAVTVNLTFSALSPNTVAVKNAITTAVTDFLLREAEPDTTIALSRLNEAISGATGEFSHTLSSPSADIVLDVDEIAIMGSVTGP